MILFKTKELKTFITDLIKISQDTQPSNASYAFVGCQGTGKTLLARRIMALFPNKIVVIDEPTEYKNIVPSGSIIIYTTNELTAHNVVKLEIKTKKHECPIVNSKSNTLKDIIIQAKKIFK